MNRGCTAEDFHKAVAIYLEIAYGQSPLPDAVRKRLVFPQSTSLQSLLNSSQFEKEDGGRTDCQQYLLRLGNRRYPHMKLLVELQPEEPGTIFVVDIHDSHFGRPTDPEEQAEFQELQRFNSGMKQQIEHAWHDAGLPTFVGQLEVRTPLPHLDFSLRPLILLIDDEADVLHAEAELLESVGYEVKSCETGAEALKELAAGLRPALFLMDVMMPEMDGFEVQEEIGRRFGNGIPVLFITGAPKICLGDRCKNLLQKPFSARELIQRVQQVMEAGPNGKV